MRSRISFKPFAVFANIFAPFAVKRNVVLILLIALPFSSLLAQSANIPDVILSIAEKLAASVENPEALASYAERLYELAEDPVSLDKPSEVEIGRLFFLSEFQVKSLAAYILEKGPVLTQYELAVIPGFDISAAAMAAPFCRFGTGDKTNKSHGLSAYILANFSTRLEEADTSLAGSPWKMLTKSRISTNGFSAGLTLEKDPGEKLASPLPDFISGFISYSGKGFVKSIVAGDYSLRFGQGTAVNNSYRPALSVSSPGYLSSRNELRQYTSTDENNFFRGLALTAGTRILGITLFASQNNIDAAIGITPEGERKFITSFYSGGYHTTPPETGKKDAVTEKLAGGAVSLNVKNTRVSLLFSGGSFSLPVLNGSDTPGDLFDFTGSTNVLLSASYTTLIRKFLLYGEFSSSNFSRTAVVQGFSARPSDRLSVNFLYRNYQAGYFSMHGNGPGTGSSTTNEEGIYGSFSLEAAKHLFISAGCDAVRYPWLRYMNSSPSRGWRQEVRILYEPVENVRLDFLYGRRMTMSDGEEGNGVPKITENTSQSIKFSARYLPQENLSVMIRADYKMCRPGNSSGFMIISDLTYRINKIPLSVWLRYALFDTDDWDSRIYTYENDLVWSFSVPAFSGQGSRSCIMISYDTGRKSEFRIKYGITSLNVLHPFHDESRELKFQFRVWF